jgi:hypothetical protein
MPKDKEIIDKDTGRKTIIEPKTFYNNYKKQKKLPVVIYADFECNLEPFVYTDKSELVKQKHYIQNKVGDLAKHCPNTYRLHIEVIQTLVFLVIMNIAVKMLIILLIY